MSQDTLFFNIFFQLLKNVNGILIRGDSYRALGFFGGNANILKSITAMDAELWK